jgi:hypothetical protein
LTTSYPRETENLIMTLATYNQCVDNVTGVSKTVPLYDRLGARHAGAKESAVISLLRAGRTKRGKHANVAGRHARPPRAFF